MGGGGGQPGLATAGGKNVEGLAGALAKLTELTTL
jgi:alanyl-tRNA synthetase